MRYTLVDFDYLTRHVFVFLQIFVPVFEVETNKMIFSYNDLNAFFNQRIVNHKLFMKFKDF